MNADLKRRGAFGAFRNFGVDLIFFFSVLISSAEALVILWVYGYHAVVTKEIEEV